MCQNTQVIRYKLKSNISLYISILWVWYYDFISFNNNGSYNWWDSSPGCNQQTNHTYTYGKDAPKQAYVTYQSLPLKQVLSFCIDAFLLNVNSEMRVVDWNVSQLPGRYQTACCFLFRWGSWIYREFSCLTSWLWNHSHSWNLTSDCRILKHGM